MKYISIVFFILFISTIANANQRDPFFNEPSVVLNTNNEKQILINARLVSVDDSSLQALGILFGMRNNNKNNANDELAEDLPSTTIAAGKVTIPIAKLNNGNLLDLQLTALSKEGRAQMLSRPEIVTNNNQTAVIESGDEIPYQERTGEGNTSTAFKKAVLRLEVTPRIQHNNALLLQLKINQDRVSRLRVNGVPAIHTQQLTTQVVLRNKQTLVLGGIYEEEQSDATEGILGLDDIPLIGRLFRQHETRYERKQLLIFVTPQIL